MTTAADRQHTIQRRITGTLFSTESLYSAGYIAAITLLSINAVQLGGSDAMAGVPSTVSLLARALIAVPIGLLMDRRGRRPALVLGYAAGAVGLAVGGLAVGWSSFLVLCLGAALTGVATAASQQARYVASEVWPAPHRARIIGLIVFAGTIGAIGGPLLAAPAVALAAQSGLAPNSGPYWVGALLMAVGVVLAFALLRPDPKQISLALEQAASPAEPAAATRMLRTIFAKRGVQMAVASMVVAQLVMNLIMVITPVEMMHHHESTGAISVVFAAHTLGMFGLATVTGWLIDRLGQRPMIAYGAGLLIVASILAPLAGSMAGLAVALFLLGLGWNFCFVAGSTMLTDQLHASERGRVQGINDALVALASGIGSLVTGVIFAASGMVGVGAVSLAATLFFIALSAWLRRPQPSVEAVQG